jgi:UDP-N-acetylmuramate dehydrogenase
VNLVSDQDAAAAVEQAAAALGSLAQRDESLADFTTYRVGGPAALFVYVPDESVLAAVRDAAVATGVAVLVVGRGSNLLVADAGFVGLVIVLGGGFAGIELPPGRAEPMVVVVAGAAASLPVVARRTAAAGLAGFEWAVGVPGSIGGAVRMNAGGHGSDMAETLLRVRVLDLGTGEDGWVPATALDLSYRHSRLGPSQVVLAAELTLRPGQRDQSDALVSEIVRWRRANQPGGANAGSVFTNPLGDSAGRLIEAAGCKGLRIGSAEVSPKHANFIQVDESGRAADVRALMAEVVGRVEAHSGVRLQAETRLVGFDDPRPRIEGS